MTKITYSIAQKNGEIYWTAAEQFSELRGKTFRLDKMEAIEIEKLKDLSLTAKILLSAVAGAVIQHLLDENIEADSIFKFGTFTVN